MEEDQLLWFLSISMLICSFLSGLVPLAFRLSDNKSRLLALLGSGILVGTALSIIIPEGVDSLYGHGTPVVLGDKALENHDQSYTPTHIVHVNLMSHKTNLGSNTREDISSDRSKKNTTWIVGMSLVVGFVLMLLIEQFSIYKGGEHGQSNVVQSSHLQNDYTLACQDDDTDIGLEEDEKAIIVENSSETKPIKDQSTHKVTIRSNQDDITNGSGHVLNNMNPNRYYDHARHITMHKPRSARVTPTLGLVIHAAADGIALGAAATTSHRDIEMIIFLAIMLHKAPAAFSLVVLLLHNGLRPATVRRHLLAFSLSAPIASVISYYGLSQSGKEALRKNNTTGIAMLFSAGTFLFVATVHVLPELIQSKLLTPKEMLFLLGGAFLPLILTQII